MDELRSAAAAEESLETVLGSSMRRIGACLSVPLVVDGTVPGELVGSFNVYSDRGEAFDPFDETLMRLLTTAAAAAISKARRWQAAGETIAQLEVVLGSRAEIDQAKVC
nr:GAF domain-containing protein [Rhodococcus wratislaviensis]